MFVVVTVIAAFLADRSFQLFLYDQGNFNGLKLLAAARVAVIAPLPLLLTPAWVRRLLGFDKPLSEITRRRSFIAAGMIALIIGFAVPIFVVTIATVFSLAVHILQTPPGNLT